MKTAFALDAFANVEDPAHRLPAFVWLALRPQSHFYKTSINVFIQKSENWVEIEAHEKFYRRRPKEMPLGCIWLIFPG